MITCFYFQKRHGEHEVRLAEAEERRLQQLRLHGGVEEDEERREAGRREAWRREAERREEVRGRKVRGITHKCC